MWKKAMVLLRDVEDKDIQTDLQFYLYQEHLTLDQINTIYALALYLLSKQKFEKSLKSKLCILTKNFAQIILT